MKKIFVALAFLLATVAARADIAIENSTIVDDGSSYTAATASNRLLVWALTGMKSTETPPAISSVAHGAAGLTHAGASAVSADQTYAFADQWYLPHASILSGAQTMAATWSAAPNDTPSQGNAFTLSDVHQTTPVVDSDIVVGTGVTGLTSPSVDVEAGGAVIFIVAKSTDSDTLNTPAGYTKVALGNFGFSGYAVAYSKLITGAGTEAPAITWTGSANGALNIVSYRKTAAAGTGIILKRRAH